MRDDCWFQARSDCLSQAREPKDWLLGIGLHECCIAPTQLLSRQRRLRPAQCLAGLLDIV